MCKEGLKEKKSLEHHQTVERPRKGTPGWCMGNCLVNVDQFLTWNSNFKTTSNLQNFLFPKISLILPKYTPKSRTYLKLTKSQKRRYVI